MALEKLSTADVAQIAHAEGLQYAITTHLSSDRITDPRLAGLWEDAREQLAEIEAILAPHYAE